MRLSGEGKMARNTRAWVVFPPRQLSHSEIRWSPDAQAPLVPTHYESLVFFSVCEPPTILPGIFFSYLILLLSDVCNWALADNWESHIFMFSLFNLPLQTYFKVNQMGKLNEYLRFYLSNFEVFTSGINRI